MKTLPYMPTDRFPLQASTRVLSRLEWRRDLRADHMDFQEELLAEQLACDLEDDLRAYEKPQARVRRSGRTEDFLIAAAIIVFIAATLALT